jgi:acyl carrier protein
LDHDILPGVKKIASDLFDIPVAKITPDMGPATVEAWDSVQQLNLMLELEQRFGVKLEPEDFEQVRTIGDAVRLIQNKLQC